MGSAKKSRDVLLKWVVAVVVIVVFVLVAFAVGLLVGYGAFKESGEESSRASSSQQNWGSVAIVDGRTVDVLEWIDSALNATAVKDNLRFERLDIVACILFHVSRLSA